MSYIFNQLPFCYPLKKRYDKPSGNWFYDPYAPAVLVSRKPPVSLMLSVSTQKNFTNQIPNNVPIGDIQRYLGTKITILLSHRKCCTWQAGNHIHKPTALIRSVLSVGFYSLLRIQKEKDFKAITSFRWSCRTFWNFPTMALPEAASHAILWVNRWRWWRINCGWCGSCPVQCGWDCNTVPWTNENPKHNR